MPDDKKPANGGSEDVLKHIWESVKRIEEGQEKLEESVEEQSTQLHELTVSITGNKQLGQKGIAERVNDSEKELTNVKGAVATMKNDLKWWGIVVMVVSGLLAFVVANVDKVLK